MNTYNNYLISIACILVFAFETHAQLRVKTNGCVNIGSYSAYPSGGKLEITGKNETLETKLFSITPNIARLWTGNSYYAYGFGIDGSGNGHIFKNLNTPTEIMTFDSYGNFGIGRKPYYKLDINGILRVNSILYPIDEHARTYCTPLSDQIKNLYKLNGVAFQVCNTKVGEYLTDNQTLNENIAISGLEKDNTTHYGLSVQQVKEFFPELVYEDNEGLVGIDYISFIPLLIEEIKKQKESIEILRSQIEILSSRSDLSANTNNSSSSYLCQNHPNPFSKSTIIAMQISCSVSLAQLCLFDIHGNLINSFLINNRNYVEINIIEPLLPPGMYIYSLIVDGLVIDTKTMVRTE